MSSQKPFLEYKWSQWEQNGNLRRHSSYLNADIYHIGQICCMSIKNDIKVKLECIFIQESRSQNWQKSREMTFLMSPENIAFKWPCNSMRNQVCNGWDSHDMEETVIMNWIKYIYKRDRFLYTWNLRSNVGFRWGFTPKNYFPVKQLNCKIINSLLLNMYAKCIHIQDCFDIRTTYNTCNVHSL